jgi:hypothetical protein
MRIEDGATKINHTSHDKTTIPKRGVLGIRISCIINKLVFSLRV